MHPESYSPAREVEAVFVVRVFVVARKVAVQTEAHHDLHLVVDNYAAHKHPKVKAWLKRHPRFHIHFTPTSSSWLNLVEHWFRELTNKRIRRSVFRNLDELVNAITNFIDAHNEDPQRFIWTAPVQRILDKIEQARKNLDKIQSA